MAKQNDYFFCGIGGSGMLPLAIIVHAAGHHVEGSDRALDQQRTNDKFDYLRNIGVRLHRQDGSGLTRGEQILVASAAVEDTVPDVAAAKALGSARLSRAQLLADLFNRASSPIGIAGTSGKSTTTGMIAWILQQSKSEPTVMNGAVMNNFISPEAPVASAVVGSGEIFVSEVDESDGSIAMFNPRIAVLNNISLDHKSMDELRALFGGFVDRSEIAILNLDNEETARIAERRRTGVITYGLMGDRGDLRARDVVPQPFGVSFIVEDCRFGNRYPVDLGMPGRHNVSNALAAIAAASAIGVPVEIAAVALSNFKGIKRRLDYLGEASGVGVIDDFAHNPDKISASLNALHEGPGRLLIMFQPHGFGPLKNMRDDFIACFALGLGADDVLLMPEPVYFGGTVDRSVSSGDIIAGVNSSGRQGEALKSREECFDRLIAMARAGDRIVVMGARDDSLTTFAEEILERLRG